jgi:hypothetical protein
LEVGGEDVEGLSEEFQFFFECWNDDDVVNVVEVVDL